MKQAIVLTHAPFQGPGRVGTALVDRGYTLDIRELHRGDPVPTSMAFDDVLVVMGGPMGVADRNHPEFGFLRHELELLAVRIAQDAPVLGICLGAQLLAFAAGAAVHPMARGSGERCYELGWTPVQFHPTSEADPILRGVPADAHMLLWHGDMFELPAKARLFASSDTCPNQAIQIGTRLFGLQFHCEAEGVDSYIRANPDFLLKAAGPDGEDRVRGDTPNHLAAAQAVADQLLGNVLNAMATPRAA
jgi:GMP synthase-like glutamine amidotransferase